MSLVYEHLDPANQSATSVLCSYPRYAQVREWAVLQETQGFFPPTLLTLVLLLDFIVELQELPVGCVGR